MSAERTSAPKVKPANLYILLALAARELHGYAIMQEVHAITEGKVRLGPGTLYRSLKEMLAQGLVEESDERPDPSLDDERRRYYRLTVHGRQVAELEVQHLVRLVSVAEARRLLGGAT